MQSIYNFPLLTGRKLHLNLAYILQAAPYHAANATHMLHDSSNSPSSWMFKVSIASEMYLSYHLSSPTVVINNCTLFIHKSSTGATSIPANVPQWHPRNEYQKRLSPKDSEKVYRYLLVPQELHQMFFNLQLEFPKLLFAMGYSAPAVVYQWVRLLCQGLNLTPIALGQSILAGAKAYPHGIHWLWWSYLNINVIQFVSNECSKLSESWIFLEYWIMNDGTVKTQNVGFRGQNLYLYSKSTCKWPLEPSKCHHNRRHEEDSNTSWVPQHASQTKRAWVSH